MRYHRKLQLVRQLSKRVRQVQLQKLLLQQQKVYSSYFQPNGLHPQQTIEDSEQDISEEEEPEDGQEGLVDDEFNLLDYIHTLPSDMVEQFRMSNPQLPDLFFMTKKQKKKYFQKINKSFKDKLAKTPQRKSKTKKILKFKNDFEIKPFNLQQKVVAISKAKEVYEGYKPDVHFS